MVLSRRATARRSLAVPARASAWCLGISLAVTLTAAPLAAQRAVRGAKRSAATAHRVAKRVSNAASVRLSSREVALYARLLQMQDRRELDTALVRAGATSRTPALRAATAFALSQVGPAHRSEVGALLDRLAQDADSGVAANAKFGVQFLTYATPYAPVAPTDTVVTNRTRAWYDTVVRTVVVPTLAGKAPTVKFVTNRGVIRVALLGTQAPLTVAHFMHLVRRGFYDGLTFHRVEPGFVAQGGDPKGTGEGGPGYAIHDEFNRLSYTRGAVGVATSGPDTGGSQFFFMLGENTTLDGRYTLFGRIVSGLEVMDALQIGDRMTSVVVE